MKVSKKDLEKSQVEISVELSLEEFAPYIEKGAKKVAEKVKIEGFRPGKAPLEVLKKKVGEMGILEEAANIAITKTVDDIVEKETAPAQPVGQPQLSITKLAPDNPLEYKVILSLLPTVELGKYKDLKLKAEEAKVDDKEVDKALLELRESRMNEKVVLREVKDKDKVMVDIKLFLSKVPVENGAHSNLEIIIGKDYLVPGFDKQLLGMKKGEEKEFTLPYPDKHHQANLAGKNVEFKVKINEVYEREVPELNDEFAKSFGVKSVDELKKAVEGNLLHEKKHKVELKNESEMIGKIVDDTKFGEFPDVLVESEANNLMAELEESVKRQGGNFEDYLKHINKKTRNELMLDMIPNAVKRVKSALIIREISIKENITPSEEDVDKKLAELKKQYEGQDKILKMMEESGYRSYLRNILNNEKVIAKLKEWNYAGTSDKQKG